MSKGSPVVYVANITRGTSGVDDPDWSTVVMLDAYDLSLLKTAKLGLDATRLALSPDGSRLWVSHPNGNQISVLEADTLKIIDVIDLSTRPYGITVAPALSPTIPIKGLDWPDSGVALVACPNEGEVWVYNMDDHTCLHTISVSVAPHVIVLTPDSSKAYVSDMRYPPRVAVLHNGRESGVLEFGGSRLQEAVVSPDGATVYISNQTSPGRVEVISTIDDEPGDPIPTPQFPRAIGISPSGDYLFTGHTKPGTETGFIQMIRLSDGELVAELGSKKFANPRTMAIVGSRIFFADHGTHACFELNVDGESLSLVASVDLNEVLGNTVLGYRDRYNALPVELVIGGKRK